MAFSNAHVFKRAINRLSKPRIYKAYGRWWVKSESNRSDYALFDKALEATNFKNKTGYWPTTRKETGHEPTQP
jgi:hypothetical protein